MLLILGVARTILLTLASFAGIGSPGFQPFGNELGANFLPSFGSVYSWPGEPPAPATAASSSKSNNHSNASLLAPNASLKKFMNPFTLPA